MKGRNDPSRPPEAKRLGKRIVALMVLVSALLSILSAGIQLHSSYQGDLDRVMSQTEVIKTSFLPGLGNALWQFDVRQTEALVDGIFAQADVAGIELSAATGEVINRGDMTSDAGPTRSFAVTHQRPDGRAVKVGNLDIAVSLEGVHRQLWSQFLTMVASNFVKTIAASAFMLWLFNRMVSRHLRDIASYVVAPAWDSTPEALALTRKPATHRDELDHIVEGLNESRARIAAARASEAELSRRLEGVLDAVASGILAFRSDGHIAMVNRQAKRMLELPGTEHPLRWPRDAHFLSKDTLLTLPDSDQPIARMLAGDSLEQEVFALSNGDRLEVRYFRLSSAEVSADEHSDFRAVLVMDDVTEQERSRQHIERISRLEALGQLSGGVAHDFNNVLQIISLALRAVEQGRSKETLKGTLEAASTAVARGADLTARLLNFARPHPGKGASSRVREVLESLEESVRLSLEESIEFSISSNHPDLWVFCDVVQLESALLGLVANAREAICRRSSRGVITVTVRCVTAVAAEDTKRTGLSYGVRQNANCPAAECVDMEPSEDGRYIEFSVSDDGPGMSEETLRRAFDPFFTTKPDQSGSGLGLSAVYGFVRQSLGSLQLNSELERGTEVRLLLPAGTADVAPAFDVRRAPLSSGEGKTLLVVDDEELLAELMTEVLQDAGYRVLVVHRGLDALNLIHRNPEIDGLVTDVVMPGGMNGFALAQKAREIRADLPVIYVSGYTGFTDGQMGNVVAPMLPKPTTPEELLQVVGDTVLSSACA